MGDQVGFPLESIQVGSVLKLWRKFDFFQCIEQGISSVSHEKGPQVAAT